MIKEKDYIKISLSEWNEMKKQPQFTELIEWLEDSLELADAVSQSDGKNRKEWKQFYDKDLKESEL